MEAIDPRRDGAMPPCATGPHLAEPAHPHPRGFFRCDTSTAAPIPTLRCGCGAEVRNFPVRPLHRGLTTSGRFSAATSPHRAATQTARSAAHCAEIPAADDATPTDAYPQSIEYRARQKSSG